MKLYLSIITLLILCTSTAFAQTPSAKPTSESIAQNFTDKINNLKEKIASRVAELNLVEKKGMIGTVTEVKSTLITATGIDGNKKLIDVDEITKFSDGDKDTGISDVKTGDKISVIGLYNKDSEHLLARFVSTLNLPVRITGAVSGLDDETFTVTVVKEDGTLVKVDVENVTKTTLYEGITAEKGGFSKITRGNRIIVVGFPDAKDKERIVATRVLLFPSLPKNPRVVIPDNAVDTTNGVVTSTGSGNKLTPLR